MSVVSLNAWGTPFYGSKFRHKFLRTKISLRFRKMGQILNESGADILCFQEVFLPRHLNRLKIQLTNYPYCVYKPYFLCPRGGLVIFSKHPIATWEYIDFSTKGKYWDKSFTGKLTRRGVLMVKLQDIPLTILNTHPVQNSSDNWDEENTYVQIIKTQLREILDICHKLSGPFILVGDFNIPKDSNHYKELIKESNFIDAFADATSPTYVAEYLFGKKDAERLDYIFYKEGNLTRRSGEHILTEKEQLDNGMVTYLSDHIGLKADFLLEI
jgi:endonuclease/exonuclease/phosphatase family metal-dependent hydrolase